MKSMRKYTIRGEITAGDVKRIQLFDGRYDTGYRLHKFIITPQRVLEAEEVSAKLMTEEKTHGVNWFWARQSEIGWASWNAPDISSKTPSRYCVSFTHSRYSQD